MNKKEFEKTWNKVKKTQERVFIYIKGGFTDPRPFLFSVADEYKFYLESNFTYFVNFFENRSYLGGTPLRNIVAVKGD